MEVKGFFPAYRKNRRLVNSQKGDFIIRIEFGEEADSCDREERLQT